MSAVAFDDLSAEFRHLGEIGLPAQVQGGKFNPLRVLALDYTAHPKYHRP